LKIWKQSILFYLGGSLYMTLEFLWRGRSHWSMFCLGGACFCLLGRIARRFGRWCLGLQALVGTGVITGLELLTGLLLNREYAIWDYRRTPMNLYGQICLPYMLLWVPLSATGLWLYPLAAKRIDRRVSQK